MADGDTSETPRPRLGISACLFGERVRCDGGHERDSFLTDALAPFVEYVPVCPEEEAGLGTPRVRQLAALHLDGLVLKKDSLVCAADSMLPVEEEGRLGDPVMREHFIERVYAFRRLRQLREDGARMGDLVRFHTRHKLQLLAHSPVRYANLGRLVANARATAFELLATDYARAFMAALATSVTRARHVNVLQHAAGYFRRVLPTAARHDVASSIVDYQRGLIPLVVPTRLMEHYAHLHDLHYLRAQMYFNPYPRELRLRNHV